MSARVMDYLTGAVLAGRATRELRAQSKREVTGAVPAYRDDAGVWQYVAPCDVERAESHMGVAVRTVWVES